MNIGGDIGNLGKNTTHIRILNEYEMKTHFTHGITLHTHAYIVYIF